MQPPNSLKENLTAPKTGNQADINTPRSENLTETSSPGSDSQKSKDLGLLTPIEEGPGFQEWTANAQMQTDMLRLVKFLTTILQGYKELELKVALLEKNQSVEEFAQVVDAEKQYKIRKNQNLKELEDAALELSNENSELREEQHISDQIIAKLEK